MITLSALHIAISPRRMPGHSSQRPQLPTDAMPEPRRSQRADGAQEGADDGTGGSEQLERHRLGPLPVVLRDLRLQRPRVRPVRSSQLRCIAHWRCQDLLLRADAA